MTMRCGDDIEEYDTKEHHYTEENSRCFISQLVIHENHAGSKYKGMTKSFCVQYVQKKTLKNIE